MKKVFNIFFYVLYILSAAALIFDITAGSRTLAIILHYSGHIDHVILGLIYEFCIPFIIVSLIILTVMNKNTVKPTPAVISFLLFAASFALLMFVFGTQKIKEDGNIYMSILLGELISLIIAVASLIPPAVIYGKALRKKAE